MVIPSFNVRLNIKKYNYHCTGGIWLVLSLLIAGPIVSLYSDSSSLNYLPGSGATGTMTIGTNVTSISAGTDNLGVNLVNYALYPSANVTYAKINLSEVTANETSLPTSGVLYTESTSLVAYRCLAVGLAYIAGFLIVAWVALKRSQIME